MNVVLTVLLIFSASKWFRYYCLSRGLMYHLGMKYDDVPSIEKAKELTSMAAERTIKEWFGKS